MIDPATPPSTKARAADSVLDHSAKAIELEDIEARVAGLERAAVVARQGRWMLRSLIHRLKRLESSFRPGYEPPEIVTECVGPNREVLRTFVLTATGMQERPKPRVLALTHGGER